MKKRKIDSSVIFTKNTLRQFSKHPLPPPNRPTPDPNPNPPPSRLPLSLPAATRLVPPPPALSLTRLRAEATTGQETADPGGKLLRSSGSGAVGAVVGPWPARRRTCGGDCRRSGVGERRAAPALARGSRRGRERLLQLGSWRAGRTRSRRPQPEAATQFQIRLVRTLAASPRSQRRRPQTSASCQPLAARQMRG